VRVSPKIGASKRFQPASGSSAGGNPVRRAKAAITRSFNPPPAHPPEETKKGCFAVIVYGFQPASGSSAGGNQSTTRPTCWKKSFNPPPAHPPEETSGRCSRKC